MLKNLLFITFILTSAFSQGALASYGDFEAELRALETNSLKNDELVAKEPDAVTGVIPDMISDEVATGQAATLRDSSDRSKIQEAKKEDPTVRARRIRSR